MNRFSKQQKLKAVYAASVLSSIKGRTLRSVYEEIASVYGVNWATIETWVELARKGVL